MPVEFDGNVGISIVEEADDLEDFEFGEGDRFVRWHPWGDQRADNDEWAVVERSFQFRVSWIRDRDDIPTRESHRTYKLLSRETFNEVYLSERDLKRGDWRHIEEIEEGAER